MKVTRNDAETVWRACHDYGIVESGQFPSLQRTLKAAKEGRLEVEDNRDDGYLHIWGEDECYVSFLVD